LLFISIFILFLKDKIIFDGHYNIIIALIILDLIKKFS